MRKPAMAAILTLSVLFLLSALACGSGKTASGTAASGSEPSASTPPTSTPAPTTTPTGLVPSAPTQPASPEPTPSAPAPTATPATTPAENGDTGKPLQDLGDMIIDHRAVTSMFASGHLDLSRIPEQWIEEAKRTLHIAYGHTSHGSQLTTGMKGLEQWKGNLYAWDDEGGQNGALDLDDYAFSSDRHDLGHKGDLAWERLTRKYLDDPDNADVNVVMWSWCAGVSDNTEEGIDTYLEAMSQLEKDYPGVHFVYMTGHSDGTGETGRLHTLNQRIRDYCRANGKILYDFYDIECYDPDGNYYGDKHLKDSCNYDGGNWAVEWQNSHTEGVDWYPCEAAHTQPLNANQKAYAVWWMLARLAGWDGM